MSRISEKSTLDVRLTVKPVLFTTYHIHAYMGSCRYGEGYALATESNIGIAQKGFGIFKKEMEKEADLRNVRLLEPVVIFWNEGFALKKEQIQKALEDDARTDFYSIRSPGISFYFAVKLSKWTDKPIGHTPSKFAISKYNHVGMTAHLFAEGKPGYASLDSEEMSHTFATLGIERTLTCTKIFFPLKNAMFTFGYQSSYLNLEGITRRFKVRFSHVNSDGVFQWLDALTDEEKAEAKALIDELEKESQDIHMPAEYILNDTEFYETIKKMMAHYGCNASAIPCFEVCATRELNRRRLTFCLAHSLFKNEEVASAHADDVGSILTITILMNIARKVPYMGSTMVLDKNTNQCGTLRNTACTQTKGYDGPTLPTEFVFFTMDSWGIIICYGFFKDNGETLTMINMSPDMRKIMIAKGTINGCDDYLTPECKHAVRYTMKDVKWFHERRKFMKHHFVLVYRDYVGEAKALVKGRDLEVLEA